MFLILLVTCWSASIASRINIREANRAIRFDSTAKRVIALEGKRLAGGTHVRIAARACVGPRLDLNETMVVAVGTRRQEEEGAERDLGANWSPPRSMNLLAFSHAREDHESAPAAPRLSSGPADFISLWLILPLRQAFLSVVPLPPPPPLLTHSFSLSFLFSFFFHSLFISASRVVSSWAYERFFFVSFSIPLFFLFALRRKPRINDIKRFVRRRTRPHTWRKNITGLESWMWHKCWIRDRRAIEVAKIGHYLWFGRKALDRKKKVYGNYFNLH